MRVESRLILTLPLVFAGVVSAQTARTGGVGGDRNGSIRGYITMPDGSPVAEAVKVTLKVLRGDQSVIYTDQQGRFELNNLTPGQYTLEVDADRSRRFVIVNETVEVRRGGGPTLVTIALREKPGEGRPAKDKTVSVAMLEQKVPAAAKKEFERASRFTEEGRVDEAIEALRKALAIYPDYLVAHNDLGAQLLDKEKFDDAATELRAAIKIDPKAFNPRLNLGIVLIRQAKFTEALSELDQAISIEPSAPAAHLYAGTASAKLNDLARGEKELQTAYDLGGTPYAIALFHLGQLYMKKGDREKALNALESYLREAPNAANAAQAEKLIGRLR